MQAPLSIEAWQQVLARHPDQTFAQYSIWQGFHIGTDRSYFSLQPGPRNLHAMQYSALVGGYIAEEVNQGPFLGTLPPCAIAVQLG